MNLEPNKIQEAAFKKVVKAMQEAKKAGLVFYGKSDVLVAYTRQAEDYVNQHGFSKLLGRGTRQIPNLLGRNVLHDSGADDYPCYATKKDEQEDGEDN